MNRFTTKALSTTAMGIALSLLLAATTTTSSASSNTPGPENPFAGSWSGTWSEPGVVGTHDWTISNAGQMTGTIYNITYDIGGALVGHVGADGNLIVIFLTPGANPSISGFPFQGTAEIDGDGKLVVSCTGVFFGGPLMVAILERN
jgi:hypothetical protein